MLKNYFKTAWRNLVTDKLFSFINIAGLSTGIAACIVIFLYVQQETGFDRHHTKADRIYRLTEILHLPKEDNSRAVTSPPMAPALKRAFPEVQNTVRINFTGRSLSYQQKKLTGSVIIYADSSLFDVFTFPLLEGDARKALVDPYTVVLTESTAKKYFGNENALGKTIQLSDSINITVTGIMKDVPANSHFTFDCVLSHSSLYEITNHQPENNWFNNNYYTYLLLPENYNYQALETKISAFLQKEMTEQRKQTGLWYDLKIQPLTDIHLKSHLNAEINPNGSISYVYIFSAAALLILLIACFNFINLSTARSLNRAKEIGLRKVTGAKRSQLVVQFLSESFLLALISSILAIGMVTLLLPFFNSLSGKVLIHDPFSNKGLLLIYTGIVIIVGFLAGMYPAVLMSSFNPVKALKSKIAYNWKDMILRKGLVVFQFTIAIILIAGTALVLQQLDYIQNQKIGLNKNQLLEIPILSKDLSKSEALINELKANSNISDVTLTDFSFKNGISSVAMIPEGATEDEITSQSTISVDENFFATFQIPLASGRNFSKTFSTDRDEAFIVNETAVKAFGWGTPEQALGKNINWGLGKKGKIIGVAKDFNFTSLHDNIKPLIMHMQQDEYSFVALRVKPNDLRSTLNTIETTWKNIAVNSPFSYSFLDDDFANLYKSEQNMRSVLILFTALSIMIASLGLFGLASFTIKQRFKEIGIRKVLGAGIGQITGQLSYDFLKLVFVSIIIAIPVTWFSLNSWLQNFAYRIPVNWLTLIAAAVMALIIAFLTVSVQAMRAAGANPMKSLRTD